MWCDLTCCGPHNCPNACNRGMFLQTGSNEATLRREMDAYVGKAESLLEMRARWSREATRERARLALAVRLAAPPRHPPKRRNRCCSGSSRHMVR